MYFTVELNSNISPEKSYYYVGLSDDTNLHDFFDRTIAKIIGIDKRCYVSILERFNCQKDENNNNECIFYSKNNCHAAVNYLNDTYGIILKLMEGA